MKEHDESLEVRNEERRRKIEKRKKKKGCFFVVLIFLLLGAVAGGVFAISQFMPSSRMVPFFKHVTRENANELTIIYQDDIIAGEIFGLYINGEAYLDMALIEKYNIDRSLFWDAKEEILTITTPQRILRFLDGDPQYTDNGNPVLLDYGIMTLNNTVYLPGPFVESYYSLALDWQPDNGIVIVTPEFEPRRVATVNKDKTSVRYEPDIKSDVAWRCDANQELAIYGETEGFYRVTTAEGVVGYIRSNEVTERETIPPVPRDTEEIPPLPLPDDGRLTMVWHQVNNYQPNNPEWLNEKIQGLDVISPTWFNAISDQGELSDIGSLEYVEKAHGLGYQVWGLVGNSLDLKMEEKRALTHNILSSTTNRYRLISNIEQAASKYHLDGINIDFEEFNYADDGVYFNQFMKELSVVLHRSGLVVSFDVNVPTDYTAAIDRAEISRYADYVVIMGYDEHWGPAAGAGSVASIGWVTQGVVNTLNMVPQEKTILGVPFYTRVWMTTQTEEGEKLTQAAYTMGGSFDFVENNGGTIEWLGDDIAQYYSEFEIEDDGEIIFVQVWLEDPESIAAKLALINEFELAGVAGWKKGQEQPAVWDVIYEYMKN